MTQLLEQAIKLLMALPETEQDVHARQIIERLEEPGGQHGQWGVKWRTLTARQRAEDFEQWMQSIDDGPGVSDEATRREAIYD